MPTTQPAAMYDMLMTPTEVADYLRQDVRTLNNARVQGRGLPFQKTPTGGVRYKMSDLLASLADSECGFTVSRVTAAIQTCPGLTADHKAELVRHLKKTVWLQKAA